MDKIIIRDLIARGIIGINDWEREKPQEILINIELYVDLRGWVKTIIFETRSAIAASQNASRRTPRPAAANR